MASICLRGVVPPVGVEGESSTAGNMFVFWSRQLKQMDDEMIRWKATKMICPMYHMGKVAHAQNWGP